MSKPKDRGQQDADSNFTELEGSEQPESQLNSPSWNGRDLEGETAQQDAEADAELERMRLPQDYSERTAGKKRLTTIPVRKPKKHEFIRVYGDPRWHIGAMLYLDPESNNEAYWLDPNVYDEFGGHAHPFVIVPTLTRYKTLFAWNLRLPGSDGRTNDWHESAREAAEAAQEDWIRLEPDHNLPGYVQVEAVVKLSEPDWSILASLTPARFMQMAFKRRKIMLPDHDILQRIRGEV